MRGRSGGQGTGRGIASSALRAGPHVFPLRRCSSPVLTWPWRAGNDMRGAAPSAPSGQRADTLHKERHDVALTACISQIGCQQAAQHPRLRWGRSIYKRREERAPSASADRPQQDRTLRLSPLLGEHAPATPASSMYADWGKPRQTPASLDRHRWAGRERCGGAQTGAHRGRRVRCKGSERVADIATHAPLTWHRRAIHCRFLRGAPR